MAGSPPAAMMRPVALPPWPRNERLEELVIDGLRQIDTGEILKAMATHVSQDGEWAKRSISPSLVASHCRLQRVHRFLGHRARPDDLNRLMALRAGRPDAVTQLNFLRGFSFEGVVVSLLRKMPEVVVVQSAPSFVPTASFAGASLSAHPDVMFYWQIPGIVNVPVVPELIQIKSPSWWGIDRLRQHPEDLAEKYELQLQTELLVCRMAGWTVAANNLLVGTWEGTPSSPRPDMVCYRVEYDPAVGNRIMERAQEILSDAENFDARGELPPAIPLAYGKPAKFPCGYCRYSRLGFEEGVGVPGCELIRE